MPEIVPGLLLLLGGPLLLGLRGRALRAALIALPVLSLGLQLAAFPAGSEVVLAPRLAFRSDALSTAFGLVFHVASVAAAVFSSGLDDRRQHATALVYAGAAIAATTAANLPTLFVLWEVTAVASVGLVWASGSAGALASGVRYLALQVVSGVLLLLGTALRAADGQSLDLGPLGPLDDAGTWLIFLAFGVKAGFPGLHTWIVDAYPRATPTGTVWLSAFTTKLAIYALARCFAGEEMLVAVGAAMALFPLVLALLEDDLRRVLAYSLVNQLGYMVVAVGVGTDAALAGVTAHAFVHVVYKGLLFMALGAVLLRTGTTRASELGGLYRTMPWTAAAAVVGAAATAGVPLVSGFVSKSILVGAVADSHRPLVSLALLVAGAGVVTHAGLRVPFLAFFGRDSGRRPSEAPLEMRVAMGGLAALCLLVGAAPGLLLPWLPSPVELHAYTVEHVVEQLQLLLGAALAFGLLGVWGALPTAGRVRDVDSLVGAVVPALARPLLARLGRWRDEASATRDAVVARLGSAAVAAIGPGRPVPAGVAVLVLGVVFSAYASILFLLGEPPLRPGDGAPPAEADHGR